MASLTTLSGAHTILIFLVNSFAHAEPISSILHPWQGFMVLDQCDSFESGIETSAVHTRYYIHFCNTP